MKCRICNSDIEPFMDFGRMPLGNGFLTPEEFATEYFYHLQVCFCPTCGMVQLAEQPDRERMFNKDYAFYSSTSTRMVQHFGDFADAVLSEHLGHQEDPFVVEIGSNDGILLQHFANAGIRHLGLEPSANVARAAIKKGVRTYCYFFDENLAREIVAMYGQADVILAANVMCHIQNLHGVICGMEILLKPGGVILFEDPYLGDIVQKTSYDQFYDEHCYYFSLASIEYLFGQHGFEIVDAQPQPVHGGSMRYTLARDDTHSIAMQHLYESCSIEDALNLKDPMTYHWLRQHIELSKYKLVYLLRQLKHKGKRVVGYAATSKSTTITNYCGITPDWIKFISDTTPIKIGKCSPGAHIPVRSHDDFEARYPDYALLFGWNHAEEIMAKEQAFRAAGGKWIVYVPEVKVME